MAHLFICTGEVSGDLQASYLIQALLRQRPDLEITAVGGERMAAAGAKILHSTTAISSMGFVEALPFIGPALWTEWKIRRWLRQTRPDLVILIDYIGINSRITNLVHHKGIPAIYYIAPQEWVWTPNRVLTDQLTQQTRLMLAIFPEEARYYEQAGGNVRWIGHPLIDIMQQVPSRQQARDSLGIPPDQIAVMLFPASRSQEVRLVAPILFEAARQLQEKLPQVKLWLPLASTRFAEAFTRLARQTGITVTLIPPQHSQAHYTALAAADLVLAKSGTVNLETAILGIPQVVIYRFNRFTYWVAKKLLKISVPFMSSPNLVQMRPIVLELLQDQAQPERIVTESIELLTHPQRRQQLQQEYQQMRLALGEPGVLNRAATEILRVLDQL